MAAPTPKYPHSQGPTRLDYSPDGHYLFTTGANSLIRRFDTSSTGEPETIDIDTAGLDIAASARHFAVATDDGNVHLFDLTGTAPQSVLLRSLLPLRTLKFSSDGQWIVMAGEDKVAVLDVEDITNQRVLPDLASPTKHISFRPGTSLVVGASSLDGIARVYDFSESPEGTAGALVFQLELVLPKVATVDDPRTTELVWSPDGAFVAVQNTAFSVMVYSCESWEQEFRLSGSDYPLTGMCWSPNGAYIAATTRGGQVLVWEVATDKIVQTYKNIDNASQIRWRPHENEISFTTDDGKLYTAPGVPEDAASPVEEYNKHAKAAEHRADRAAEKAEARADFKAQRHAAARRLGGDSDGDEDEDLDDDDTLDAEADGQFDDLFDEDPYSRSRNNRKSSYSHNYSSGASKRQRTTGSGTAVGAQKPFQSGATPWINDRRYLCMNVVGYVWSIQQDAEHNTVTIDFFDESLHRQMHFSDEMRFDLASLSEEACLFATSTSGLVAMRFHDSTSDNWQYQVPHGDTVQSIALSSEVVVVCTGKGLVLTFTMYGQPLFVSRQSRDRIVTCAAHENIVVVVRQSASGLTYSVEDASTQRYLQKDDVMDVHCSAELRALFFTETGDPCIVDSRGVLSVLVRWRGTHQARWVPLFDAVEYAKQQNRQESYWGLGIYDNKLLCVVLKGLEKYPPIPLPVTTEIELAVPGVQGVECEYIVRKILYTQFQERAEYLGLLEETADELFQREIDLDKLLLRQLQTAWTDKKFKKGLRIALELKQQEAIEAAAKIAMHFELPTYADKIMEIMG